MIYIVTHKNYRFKPDIDRKKFDKNYKVLDVRQLAAEHPDDLILQSHEYLNEWCAQYYIWKYAKRPEILGFCHYRRIIDVNDVDVEKIKNDGVQYFELYEIPFQNYRGFKDQKKYGCLDAHCRYFDFRNGYDDFMEFHKKKGFEYFDKKKFDYAWSLGENYFLQAYAGREMYVANVDIFDRLTEYIYEYVKFILEKYDIKTVQDFREHNINVVHGGVPQYKAGPDYKLVYYRNYSIMIEYMLGIYLQYMTQAFCEKLYFVNMNNYNKFFI